MGDRLKSDLGTLFSGTALAFTGTTIGNALVYLLGLIIGRLLGADVVGLYFLGLVFLQVSSSVCRLGLAEGLLRYVSIYAGQQDARRVKGTVISALALSGLASAMVAAILYRSSNLFAIRVFDKPDFAHYMRWFAAALPFFTLTVLLLNAIQALRRMDLVVIARDIIQPTLLIALSLLLYWFSRDVSGFLLGHFLAVACTFFVTFLFMRRQALKFDTGSAPLFAWATLLHFSLPIAFGDLASYTFRWADTFLISLLTGSTETGIYNAALRTTLLLNLLAASVNALYGPLIADRFHQGRIEGVQLILRTLLRWCLTASLPIVLALVFLSKGILALWGAEFVAGSDAMILLSFSQLIALPSCVLAFTLLMCGKQVIESLNVVFIVPVNIGLNLFLIPRYGINGAAWAMLSSQALLIVVRSIELQRSLDLRAYTTKFLKPVLAIVPISLLTVYAMKSSRWAVAFSVDASLTSIVIAAIAIIAGYFAVLMALGIEAEDVTLLRELRQKLGKG